MAFGSNPKTIKYWIDISEYDLETAKAMLQTGRYLYVGFMCHQCIEKALKAVFVLNVGTTPPYSHDLLMLSDKGGVSRQFSQDQENFVRRIASMNIEGRYPPDKDALLKKLSEKICREMIKNTEDLFLWLKAKL